MQQGTAKSCPSTAATTKGSSKSTAGQQVAMVRQSGRQHLSAYGTRLITRHANAEFRRITAATGIGANAVNPPRIHDMRHTMAVRTLAGWYRDGGDVAARMPLLSAYLGHVSPVSTYWYLHSVPELLMLAVQRLENAQAAS
jgi:integrase